ncbi:hypothetical protein HWQ46_25810 [Shewanella sp. D64]|uniref:hypothetical protein n=1 Tax=unclassified Shewanella TaxID=196818 RepID=UPI0022BA1510|nr:MULTISPECIES: hypothetical protein [unclassified Shewanella]MEC4728934.1 hypothetical protein [Shewanella sp. D64]MEC4740867.1 hypothetical protein [Shewanella sp. E94]WBJ96708.1 hypothetical protein HWQ47_06225 [Shewanella sp. MTB7]
MSKHLMVLYFAEIALNDAMLTGENQLFLSASFHENELIRKHVIHLKNRWT